MLFLFKKKKKKVTKPQNPKYWDYTQEEVEEFHREK